MCTVYVCVPRVGIEAPSQPEGLLPCIPKGGVIDRFGINEVGCALLGDCPEYGHSINGRLH